MTCIESMAHDCDPTYSTLSKTNGTCGVKQLVKENLMKPEKVKSRWRRNSEMETEEPSTVSREMSSESSLKCVSDSQNASVDSVKFPSFELLEENLYLFERKKTKRKKEVRRMRCECVVKPNEPACGDECLNRLLMIECGSRCITGEACSNRRFEKRLYVKTQPFKTEKKGFGLKVLEDVPKGSFIIEYQGEVLDRAEFKKRVKLYSREKEEHYYFMALKIDEIIDARFKANVSRFINHSCNPNCETQKWTVNGELRIGFFAKRDIKANEELTFDYKLERYGRRSQKCYCQSENCKGFIGVSDETKISIETKKESKNKRKRNADKEKEERKKDVLEDLMLEEEIEKLSINAGLRNKDDTLMLSRLMVRAEDSHSREKLLDIILGTTEVACLRLFLDYHGLTLFWSWMADLKELTDFPLKKKILKALSLLPVPNRTMLSDSKVLNVVEKWASCSASVHNEERESTKVKSCDTSDSDTERTFSEGENLSNSQRDRTHFSHCDVNISKALTSLEKTGESSGDTEESSCDNKTSDTNLRSDEESGDNSGDKDETLDNKEYILHTTEISNLAKTLLDSWKDLKETFRIPRREKKTEEEKECKNNSESNTACDRKSEIKNRNSKYSTKGNFEEKSHVVEETSERQKIKVVYGMKRTPDEKRTPYNFKSHSGERRPNEKDRWTKERDRSSKRNNFTVLYQYDGSSDYKSSSDKQYDRSCDYQYDSSSNYYYNSYSRNNSHNDYSHNENYTYSSPAYTGENFHHCDPQPVEHIDSHLYNKNICGPRPPLLPTPPTLPNMGITTNIVCAPPPQTPVTTAPPVIPNVMFPPPANQLQFLNLQPLTVSPVASEHSATIGLNLPQSNNILPASHLVSIPAVQSSIFPIQVNASSSEPAGYVSNESTFPNENSIVSLETSLPVTLDRTEEHEHKRKSRSCRSRRKKTYLVQENEEAPRSLPTKLPPNWRTAKDPEGNIYYYHLKTRETQWDPPEVEESMDMDSTPTYDEPKEHKHESHSRRSHKKKHSKRKTTATTAAADTSSREMVNGEIAKKIRELFRTKMSSYVVQCLNPYRKDDCKVGKITSNEDFKHLARKLTHFVMAKELKHCKNIEDLDANDSVKLKAKDYIRKYMDRYGPVYRKEKSVSMGTD